MRTIFSAFTPFSKSIPASRDMLFWALRFTTAILLIRLVSPPVPTLEIAQLQTVETQHPALCVHTRLMDEVDEWKIQRSLQWVREMGAGTIVEFFPWAYIEPERGQYNWESADRILRHARANGIRIIARLGFVPTWARENASDESTTLNTLPADSYSLFAAYAAAFAERYQMDIDHFIVWNEPNLAFEWGYHSVSAEAYSELLRVTYESIHRVHPRAVVLAAPLAPTLEPPGSPHGLNDLLYLEALYQAGAMPFFDALAVHTYGFTAPPDEEPMLNRLNFRRAELLRDIMVRYGDAETPVYITETGWNDDPRWTLAVSPAQRIAYTVDAIRYAETHWDWMDNFCVWVFRFPAPTQRYPDGFTLVTTDFVRKPIYDALQGFARGMLTGGELWLPPPVE